VSVGSLRLSKATGNGQYTGSVSMIIFRGAIVADVNEKSFLQRLRSVETTIFAQYACGHSFAISSNGKSTIVGLKTTKREWGLSFGGAISPGQYRLTILVIPAIHITVAFRRICLWRSSFALPTTSHLFLPLPLAFLAASFPAHFAYASSRPL